MNAATIATNETIEIGNRAARAKAIDHAGRIARLKARLDELRLARSMRRIKAECAENILANPKSVPGPAATLDLLERIYGRA